MCTHTQGEKRRNTGVFSRVTTAEKTGFYIAYVVSIDLKPPERVTLEAVCRMFYGLWEQRTKL